MPLADLSVGRTMPSRAFPLSGIDAVLHWSAGLAEVEAGCLSDRSGSGLGCVKTIPLLVQAHN